MIVRVATCNSGNSDGDSEDENEGEDGRDYDVRALIRHEKLKGKKLKGKRAKKEQKRAEAAGLDLATENDGFKLDVADDR